MTSVAFQDAQAPLILVIDIGTSSLRALLFDAKARQVEGTRVRRLHHARISDDGGAELDAKDLFQSFVSMMDKVLARLPNDVEISGVTASSLACNILGVDNNGNALTPVYLYSDTRNAGAVKELQARVDWTPIYARTGCPLHTSYLPARFLWLQETQPELFRRATRWMSVHEYFLQKLFSRAIVSHSLASWTGMLNRASRDWDDELLELIGVRREQFSPLVAAQDFLTNPDGEHKVRWRALANAAFFPAIGDGAAANLGSGCTDATSVSITVGTSGALRAVIPPNALNQIPSGLWVYTVDERRSLLGGSLNNGGNVFARLREILQLPPPENLEAELATLEPDAHGLTLLPFFAGERSPGYHGEARAAIIGLSLDTSPLEIWRAVLEAISYRFGFIYSLLREAIPPPEKIVASGSALFHSRVWVQILADVFGMPVIVSDEEQSSARGAALLALEALGVIQDAAQLPAASREIFYPEAARYEIYRRAMERQQRLYSLLIENREGND